MKTSEIKLGVLYAIGESQRERHRGIVLATEPHRQSIEYRTGRQVARLRPDPNGSGYGRRGRSIYSGERGLPVLMTYRPFLSYDEKPAVTDDELIEMAKRLIADGFTGDELDADQRVFLDNRARLEVVRPRAIERLWADHLEIERRDREARQAEADRQARVRNLAAANRERVRDLLTELGVEAEIPSDWGHNGQVVTQSLDWGSLANLLHEVADAAVEPYRDVIDAALSEVNDDNVPHMIDAEHLRRMRELLGPCRFSQAWRARASMTTKSGRVLTDADIEEEG